MIERFLNINFQNDFSYANVTEECIIYTNTGHKINTGELVHFSFRTGMLAGKLKNLLQNRNRIDNFPAITNPEIKYEQLSLIDIIKK